MRLKALFTLACTALCAGSLLAAGAQPAAAQSRLEDFAVGHYAIGGDFTLTNQDGHTAGLKAFRGKAVLLTFGYTHCPDVCPATMAQFKNVKRLLGAQGAHLQVVFISVDARRDTPAVLKRWVRNFDPSFAGFTGSTAALQHVSDQYMSKFRVHDEGGTDAEEVDHLAFIYLIDPAGKVRYMFSPEVKQDLLVAGVKAVLAGKS
jgi:protein SCO1